MSEGSKNPSLREIVGAPVDVTIGGKAFPIAPMGWYQASIAMEHLLPVLEALPRAADGAESQDQKFARWAGVVMTFRNEVAEFAAAATGWPTEELKALPPTPMVELVLGLVEVNADFFGQSLPGVLEGARGRLARLMERWAPLLEAARAVSGADSTTSSSA